MKTEHLPLKYERRYLKSTLLPLNMTKHGGLFFRRTPDASEDGAGRGWRWRLRSEESYVGGREPDEWDQSH